MTLFPPATLGVGQFDQGLFDPRLTFTPESPPLPYDAANGVASGPPLPLRRDDATPATDQAAPAAGDGNGGD